MIIKRRLLSDGLGFLWAAVRLAIHPDIRTNTSVFSAEAGFISLHHFCVVCTQLFTELSFTGLRTEENKMKLDLLSEIFYCCGVATLSVNQTQRTLKRQHSLLIQ